MFFTLLPEDKTPQSPPALPQFPALGDSYHFSPPAPLRISYSRGFYRVNRHGVSELQRLNSISRCNNTFIILYVSRLMMSSRHISTIPLYEVSFASHPQGLLLIFVSTEILRVCTLCLKHQATSKLYVRTNVKNGKN